MAGNTAKQQGYKGKCQLNATWLKYFAGLSINLMEQRKQVVLI